MNDERLFELRRRTFDTPEFGGIEFIEVEAKSIINHVPGNYLPFNWTINPYRGCSNACEYCFARVTHTYLDMNAGRDFETKIVVKTNAVEVLQRQLAARSWKGEHIAMGTATDPYQRAEGRYKLMRGIIQALIDFRNPFSILTKCPLILRDLDLLVEASKLTEVSTALSIGTLDEDAWRRSEPGTPHPKARMEAVAEMNRAGIPSGVMVAPLLPGITDSPEQIRAVVEAAIEAGATHVSPILLHLRPVVREEYMDWLAREYPHLVPRYEKIYPKAYASQAEQRRISHMVEAAVEEAGGLKPALELEVHARHRGSRPRGRRGKENPSEQMRLI